MNEDTRDVFRRTLHETKLYPQAKKPSDTELRKAKTIAVDPATKNEFKLIDGTVWMVTDRAVVNRGSLADFKKRTHKRILDTMKEAYGDQLSQWSSGDAIFKHPQDDIYFRPTQRMKNGNLKGKWAEPRRRSVKVITRTVDSQWASSWKKVSDVPEDVRDALS